MAERIEVEYIDQPSVIVNEAYASPIKVTKLIPRAAAKRSSVTMVGADFPHSISQILVTPTPDICDSVRNDRPAAWRRDTTTRPMADLRTAGSVGDSKDAEISTIREE